MEIAVAEILGVERRSVRIISPHISPMNTLRLVSRLFLFLTCLAPSAWTQTVATPTFLPVEGVALARFPVVVSCPTSGATIRYTVTGAEPTQFDPVVVSGATVDMARNMTLKAKAWSGAISSATASTTFEVTGDLAAGSQNLLALVTNGQVMGWGNQDFGRLANGSTATTNILVPSAAKYSSSSSITNASRITAGAKHSLMLDSSGNVWGFGNNLLGEAGRATPAELLYAAQVTKSATITDYLTGCTNISAGLDFSAALESGGFVRTWGSQVSGRLANGSSATGSRKFAGRAKTGSGATDELSAIRDVALGKDFALAREACGLESTVGLGRLWVWGNNASANLATGNTTAQSYAVKAKLNATTDLSDAWDIDAGDAHSAVVRWKTGDTNLQGSVWTFGSRVDGRLGDNGAITGTATYPVQVQKLVGSTYSPLTGISQISAGPTHTLALDNQGQVWAWGDNLTGALGDNTVIDKKYAVKVRNPGNTADLTNIVRISAGGINLASTSDFQAFSSAVARDGTIYVWGSNKFGVLANGATSNTVAYKLPVVVAQLKTIPGFPTVSLAAAVTAPTTPGAATLTATVGDPQGAANLQKTEFYVQGVLNSTKTAAPWTAPLTALGQGIYSAYAKTTDVDGNVTTSLATSFTIAPPPDSDGDGLLDSWETQHFGNLNQLATADPDADKISNLNEFNGGTNPNSNADANTDGIPDDWVVWNLAQTTGVATSSLPANGDPDLDEITNLAEYQNGTNPRLLDTDVDGQSDWQELAQGTDAKNAASLGTALEVSGYQGLTNLTVPQTLGNPALATSYALALSGNVPPASGSYEMGVSSQAGGPAYEWIDISANGEHLMAFETDAYALVQRPVGFPFSFYGTSYSNLFISGQGFMRMTDPGGSSPGFPVEFRAPLPNAAGHKPLIAPYEQYLEPHVQGDIYYKAFAGYTVVQWEQVKINGYDSRPTFQAVIYADGSIRFNYKSIPLTSGNQWISGYLTGIQNGAGNQGLAASWYSTSQQGLLLHNLAPVSVRFAPPAASAPWVTASAATVNGNPLSWNLVFQGTSLGLGVHQAQLELRMAGGPVLYSRTLKLTLTQNPDADNDGLPDAWETQHFGNLNQTAGGDADSDKVTNLQEFQVATNPNSAADANADAIPDDWVVWQLSLPGGVAAASLPATGDPDQDALTNLVEFQNGTNPRLLDTDVDGQSDWQELAQGTDPKAASPQATALEVAAYQGAADLTIPQSLANPMLAASYALNLSGNGGATPWVTASTAALSGNPLSWNLVFHGQAAGLGLHEAVLEIRKTGGPALFSRAIKFTVTQNPDTDGDGLLDSWETTHFGNLNQTANSDPDGDSVSNLNELAAGTNPNANVDANSDGLPDDWVTWQLSLPGGVNTGSLPPNGDPDQDELTNLAEYQNGTNPRQLDSDVDGQSDWQELAQDTNPNDVSSLIQPLDVSAHQGTTNFQVSQSLPNSTPANSYELSLSGNVPATPPYKLTSSNIAGGPAYEWIEISSTGEQLMAFETDRNIMIQRPIGFAFLFYGVSYSNLYISGQGFVTLTDPGGSSPGSPKEFGAALPNFAGHKPLIAPYEQYLAPDVQGDIYYKAFSGFTVIQWEQVQINSFDNKPTFQAVIYADGSIRFNYKSIPLTSDGFYIWGYLSGIQNATGDQGLAASWGTTSQQGMQLHNLAPISLRFAAPIVVPTPWVTSAANTASGTPLSWELNFQASGLQPGNHEALLQLRKDVGSPVLYSRIIRLSVLPLGTSGNDTLTGTVYNDSLFGLDGDDLLDGNSGNDSLNGGAGDDLISGQEGDDFLLGGSGNDSMRGNAGDDEIEGEAGKDSYYYNLGDGNDVITDYLGVFQADDATADYSDLYFGPGITPAMIKSTYVSSSNGQVGEMKFEIVSGIPGSVTVKRWQEYADTTYLFISSRWRFHFDDGTTWSGNLFGYDYRYPLLFSGFSGGINDDVLVGTNASESLRGLEGNDLLQGGFGSDRYYYKWGDGNDVIRDIPNGSEYPSEYLTIYGSDLSDHLTFDFVAPDHLRINVSNPTDPAKNGSVMIEGWYQRQSVPVKYKWDIVTKSPANVTVNISDILDRASTNGPDSHSLSLFHTANGQSFDAGLGDDFVSGSSWDETIIGNFGNDTLSGEQGNDALEGGAGNDLLEGGNGIDTLKGGTGDDVLRGGNGSDVYEWNLGDGNDTISDSTSETASGIENRLTFGTGIASSQIEMVSGSGWNLKFNVRDINGILIGSVTIKNWYSPINGGANHASNWRIMFLSDPTVWVGGVFPTDGNDHLLGSVGNDDIHGALGDDSISGLTGNDSLFGDDGIDHIQGGDGADSIHGGTGDDTLDGGLGNDTYYWNIGDGNDQISNETLEGFPTLLNRLVLGVGITPENIYFTMVPNESGDHPTLKINIKNPDGTINGSVVFHHWYRSPNTSGHNLKYWQIEFNGGPIWKAGNGFIVEGRDMLLDVDGDEMDDVWEISYGLNPISNTDAILDSDGDSYSNYYEYVRKSSPVTPDSPDPISVGGVDEDQDGMVDSYETANGLIIGLDDALEDKDSDGIPNIFEFAKNTSSANPNSKPVPNFLIDAQHGGDSTTDFTYSTIQEAFNRINIKTSDGKYPLAYSIVQVKSGIYQESLSIGGVSILLKSDPNPLGNAVRIISNQDLPTIRIQGLVSIKTPQVIDGFVISHGPERFGSGVEIGSIYQYLSHRILFKNCIITNNSARNGGAILNYGANLTLAHCTITRNAASDNGRSIYSNDFTASQKVKFINSIVWGNSGAATSDIVSYTAESVNSIITDGAFGGMNLDPQLIRTAWLKQSSPAINALGEPNSFGINLDIHGESRSDGFPDIGADEYCDSNGQSDQDGVPDWAENIDDQDGLASSDEYLLHGTDPGMMDSDNDGLADQIELQVHSTDPRNGDSDNDGLLDGTEIRLGLLPTNPNSDGDSMPDNWEVAYGLNPVIDDSQTDTDGDGLTNAAENAANTDPISQDTDRDGMKDGWEIMNGTNPLISNFNYEDIDNDLLDSRRESEQNSLDNNSDTDGDGWGDYFEFQSGTNPRLVDSDTDGIIDFDEDFDNDGLTNRIEVVTHFSNPLVRDSDGDGLLDGQEVTLGMNPIDRKDGQIDSDQDGLNTGTEILIGTNPQLRDSDNDGIEDGLERTVGLNPLSSDSDNDGITDLDEDLDGDNLTNRQEFEKVTYIKDPDTDHDGISDDLDTEL